MATTATADGEEPEPAKRARRLLRRAEHAALSTLEPASGWPYASLVLVTTDHDAAPLLMLSGPARHTRNLSADPRVSLLVDGSTPANQRLDGPRLTVLGTAAPSTDPHHRSRILARHPQTAQYAGSTDFTVYRIAPTEAHLVAGFDVLDTLGGTELVLPRTDCEALIAAETGMIDHMNEDHRDAVAAYAAGLLGSNADGWRLVGLDPEGIDLGREGELARLDFDRTVTSPREARRALVELAERARSIIDGGEGNARC